jgi:predicted regulator of Ras-like GTPase activity (Roadblock/LC7/MglB family)
MAIQRANKHLVLTEEGLRGLNNLLGNLVLEAGARAALIIDQGGQMIAAQGETHSYDTMSLAALLMGSFHSTKAIALHLGETEFTKMFQQGQNNSLYMVALETQDTLAIIFPNQVTVGRIKYRLEQSLSAIDQQVLTMYRQTPSASPIRPAQAPVPKINDLF